MPPAKIFISHSSQDTKLALTICDALEARGLDCWIDKRDIGPGQNYQDAIVRAIRESPVMVLVFSSNANASDEILKELSLASKYKVSVIPVRIEDALPSEAFELELATRQWVNLFENWEQGIDRLAGWISQFTPDPHKKDAWKKSSGASTGLMRHPLTFVGAGAAVAVLIFTAMQMGRGGGAPATVGLPPASPPGYAPPPAPNAPTAALDPGRISGCWTWPVVGFLRFESDGRITNTPLQARWRSVAGNRYALQWPAFEDYMILAADAQSMRGKNNYGFEFSATRRSGVRRGTVAGTWEYNGTPTTISEDGDISGGPIKGKWTLRGNNFTVAWQHSPVDDLTLSDDGQRLTGMNNFQTAINATRTQCPH